MSTSISRVYRDRANSQSGAMHTLCLVCIVVVVGPGEALSSRRGIKVRRIETSRRPHHAKLFPKARMRKSQVLPSVRTVILDKVHKEIPHLTGAQYILEIHVTFNNIVRYPMCRSHHSISFPILSTLSWRTPSSFRGRRAFSPNCSPSSVCRCSSSSLWCALFNVWRPRLL